MNTRHPFSRLLAAWSDKFRQNIPANAHFEMIVNATSELNQYPNSEKRGKIISFPTFLDFISAGNNTFYNRHFKTSYWT